MNITLEFTGTDPSGRSTGPVIVVVIGAVILASFAWQWPRQSTPSLSEFLWGRVPVRLGFGWLLSRVAV